MGEGGSQVEIPFDFILALWYGATVERDAAIFEEAQGRARLTLSYELVERELTDFGHSGPDIDCAYTGVLDEDGTPHLAHKGDGVWFQDEPDEDSVEAWLKFWMESAINEAVHEALEHYHVDGKPYLDPHDSRYEADIFRLVHNLVTGLHSLKAA